MNNSNNTYPTVATIIGCPEELKGADGLVATPLVLKEQVQGLVNGTAPEPMVTDDTSHIKDPVQRAVIDNILGKVPTKPQQEKLRCDLCNVEVTAKSALITHLSGSRHAKRVKEESMNDSTQSPYIVYLMDKKIYRCDLCNTTMNARIQITAHLSGNKHRSKLGIEGKFEKSNKAINSDPAKPKVDATLNLLYCATCSITVNSETQLQQHTSSKKHINKVNGVVVKGRRPTPYPVGANSYSKPYSSPGVGRVEVIGGGPKRGAGASRPRGGAGGGGLDDVFHRRAKAGSPPYRASYQYHQEPLYNLSGSFVSAGYHPSSQGYQGSNNYRNSNQQYSNHPYC